MTKSLLSANRFWYTFSGCWFLWVCLYAWLIARFGYSLKEAFTDSIFTNLYVALCCLLISNMLKYYLPQKERYWYIVILSLALSGLVLLAVNLTFPVIFRNDPNFLKFISFSLPVRFVLSFLLIGTVTILSVLWYTIKEDQEQQERQSEAERISKDAELYKLRHQLQPHFLFNSLNSINALIGSQPQRARTMIYQLSEFLRGTLKKEEHQWVSLEEELAHLHLYLEIEKVRFGHRLNAIIQNNTNGYSPKLPSMILQPLVENAIKFGLYDTLGEITILMKAAMQQGNLLVEISNPYDPSTTAGKGTGFGLKSIKRKLYLLFARNDLLATRSEDQLFITTIKIPQHD